MRQVTIIFPTLPLKKLRHTEVKWLAEVPEPVSGGWGLGPPEHLTVRDAARTPWLDTLPSVTDKNIQRFGRENELQGDSTRGCRAAAPRSRWGGPGPLPGVPFPAATTPAPPAAAQAPGRPGRAHAALGERPAPPGIGKARGRREPLSLVRHATRGQARGNEAGDSAATPAANPRLTPPGRAGPPRLQPEATAPARPSRGGMGVASWPAPKSWRVQDHPPRGRAPGSGAWTGQGRPAARLRYLLWQIWIGPCSC